MTGMPIDQNMEMTGGFLQFLHPFALLGGIMFLSLCVTHGLQFITIRTTSTLQERARKVGKRLAPFTILLVILFVVFGYVKTDIFTYHGSLWVIVPIMSVVTLIIASYFNGKGIDGWAFFMTTATIILLTATIFIGMFPRVMISSISDAYSLTITNAASGAYTLKVMTYASLLLLPFVLGYQGWSYYVFHKRIQKNDKVEY